MKSELREELENAARLRRPRRVVIAGDEDDHRVRQRLRQPRELNERVENRLIRRANGVKDVARENDDVRRQRDDAIDGRAKGRGDVGFPLIDAAGSQSLVLPVTEMQIGQMNQTHAARGKLGRNLTSFSGVHVLRDSHLHMHRRAAGRERLRHHGGHHDGEP